ncbi:hypothetical protein ACVJBD_006663 [Rhizobium mongolense]
MGQRDIRRLLIIGAMSVVHGMTGLPVTQSIYWETSRLPVVLLNVWKRTFSLSDVAGDIETGQVTSESLR